MEVCPKGPLNQPFFIVLQVVLFNAVPGLLLVLLIYSIEWYKLFQIFRNELFHCSYPRALLNFTRRFGNSK